MPRKRQTGPKMFVPKATPLEAMRVEPPYKAITDWCGWGPVKQGSKVIFLAEFPEQYAKGHRAWPGDYIVRQPDGTFAIRLGDDFEKYYEEMEN